jgi:hypothetical protein
LYPGGLYPKERRTALRLATHLKQGAKTPATAPVSLDPGTLVPRRFDRWQSLSKSSVPPPAAPKPGGAVALLGDLREQNGVDIIFFGQPATATPFPVFLARTYNVPLIAGRSIRLKGISFQIEAQAVDIPHTASPKDDIQEGTQRLHTLFESWIREYPEQWMWPHRKWKK